MNAVPGAGNCPKETASAAQRRHRPRHACGSLGLIARLPRPPSTVASTTRLAIGTQRIDAALGAERCVPCAGAPWRGHQTCDAGTLSAAQNSVGDFTVGGRADACLPVERRRGIRAPFATVLGRVRRRTAGVRAYFCVFTHRLKRKGRPEPPRSFLAVRDPVSPGSPMLLRFWAKVCLNPDVYPTTRSPP
jgi:hypothetical protein